MCSARLLTVFMALEFYELELGKRNLRFRDNRQRYTNFEAFCGNERVLYTQGFAF